MKLHFLVLFLVNKQVLSGVAKKIVLRKAILGIAESLKRHNQFVTIVSNKSEAFDSAAFLITADIPYIVTKLANNNYSLHLNSSAILSVDSLKSLELLNQRIVLPSTFKL